MNKIFTKIKKNFFAGLLVLFPITVTIIILNFLYNLIIISTISRIRAITFLTFPRGLDKVLREHPYLWDAFFILLLIFGISFIGIIARNSITVRWLIKSSEKLLAHVPLINKIYNSIQQISQAILGEKKTSFNGVVLLEYPKKEIWCIGLVSGESARGEVQEKTKEKMISIFLPTTPNPTSGLYVLVPKKDTIPLEMSIDEALTMIVSVGVVVPHFKGDKKTGDTVQAAHCEKIENGNNKIKET